jgi:hypothetical protein
MATDEEIKTLRGKIASVLATPHTFKIRFEVANVSITRFMYHAIASSIADGTINVVEGDGEAYYHDTDTLMVGSLNPPSVRIVHEATHAIIDATLKGKWVRRGVHELAAYLAESIWAVSTGTWPGLDIAPLDRPMRALAQEVVAYNANPKNVRLYQVSPENTRDLQLIMENSKARMVTGNVEKMDGIGGRPWAKK